EEEDEEGGEEEEEGSEIIFGSEPIGVIGKTQPRAVIRIERDYSARGATTGRVRFWDGWIDELDGRITPLQLQNTLNDLNSILASAYDPYKSILDNTLSILTLYLSPLIIDSHYKKQMSLFGKTIEEYNRTIYNPVGLNLLHPRRVAFLFLEIEYY
ncbi:Golgin subfamily A member 7/ERF4 family-domain-containing protein, partial [Phakopsora pachyrhizi]